MKFQGLSLEPRIRLSELRAMQVDIAREIIRLSIEIGEEPRPVRKCKRCGWEWRQNTPNKKPRVCSRCHSSAWDEDTVRTEARQPSDPPNPRWRTRKTREEVRRTRQAAMRKYLEGRTETPKQVAAPVPLVFGTPPGLPIPPGMRKRTEETTAGVEPTEPTTVMAEIESEDPT